MRRWPPVRAVRLHGTKTRSGHDRRVSIFPFFGPDGAVHAVMVTDHIAGTISLASLDEGGVRVPIAGRCDIPGLRPVDDEGVATLSGLWHYDPWWVLARPAHSGHWATPLLKRTNCVDFLSEGVQSLWFARDLSAVTWAEVQDAERMTGKRRTAGAVTLTRWSPGFLSSAAGRVQRQCGSRPIDPRGAWVLDPIWSKAAERRRP
ncbi:MAG: hypothetical protein P1T08_13570 [Acidimicrobiia bacterium]|nr:hypothetical protein [Acidimicrobiia bacterium]